MAGLLEFRRCGSGRSGAKWIHSYVHRAIRVESKFRPGSFGARIRLRKSFRCGIKSVIAVRKNVVLVRMAFSVVWIRDIVHQLHLMQKSMRGYSWPQDQQEQCKCFPNEPHKS